MTGRRLVRLEAQTPAARANEQTRELFSRALHVACIFHPGAEARIRASEEWAQTMAPLPLHSTVEDVVNELDRRIELLAPLLEALRQSDSDPLAVFLWESGARPKGETL